MSSSSDLIRTERNRQRQDFGDWHDDQHSQQDWLDLLDHYVVAEGHLPNYRVVQVAALAVAAIEAFDRKHDNVSDPLEESQQISTYSNEYNLEHLRRMFRFTHDFRQNMLMTVTYCLAYLKEYERDTARPDI